MKVNISTHLKFIGNTLEKLTQNYDNSMFIGDSKRGLLWQMSSKSMIWKILSYENKSGLKTQKTIFCKLNSD